MSSPLITDPTVYRRVGTRLYRESDTALPSTRRGEGGVHRGSVTRQPRGFLRAIAHRRGIDGLIAFPSTVGVGLCLACGAGGDKTPTGPAPGTSPLRPPNPTSIAVTVNPTLAASDRVSAAAGGILTATGIDGTRFTLTIPQNALFTDTTITVTPVVSVTGLPFAGGLAGAVQLAPEGLKLFAPATLVVELAKPLAVDRQITFGYHGSGQELYLNPTLTDPKSISLIIGHFSGAGIASGTADEAAQQAQQHPPTSAEDQYAQLFQQFVQRERLQIASGKGDPAQFGAGFIDLLRGYYRDVVTPAVAIAVADDSQLGEFATAFRWLRQVEVLGFADRFTTETQTMWDQFRKALTSAFDKAYTRCLTQDGRAGVTNMIALVRQTQLLGLQLPLDLTKINECLIATIDVTPTSATIQPGNSQSYTALAKDEHGATLANVVVNWASSASAVATISATGAAQGVALGTTQITAAANGVTSAPANLRVANPSPCGGLGDVAAWTGTVTFSYTGNGAAGSESIHIHESGSLSFRLTGSKGSWTAKPPNGTASMNTVDTVTHPNSPPTVTTSTADGPVLGPTPLSDGSAVILNVNLATCAYNFAAGAVANVTTTTTGGSAPTTLPMRVGAVRADWRPSAGGLVALSGSTQFPAHSLAWNSTGDAYTSDFVNALIFGGFRSESDAGNAAVSWSFTPVL